MQIQTRPLEMDAKATKNKIDETKKDKRADILIICLLSSSNDLRTSCSKYQLYIYFIFCACWSLFTSLLLFESIRWKFGQVTKHRKITIIFWFLSLFWRIFWAPLQMMTPSIFFYVFISDFEFKGISILMKPWMERRESDDKIFWCLSSLEPSQLQRFICSIVRKHGALYYYYYHLFSKEILSAILTSFVTRHYCDSN